MRYLVAAGLALLAGVVFYLATDMSCRQKNRPKIADAILIDGRAGLDVPSPSHDGPVIDFCSEH